MLELFNILNLLFLLILIIFILIKADLIVYLILSEFAWILVYSIIFFIGYKFDIVYLLNFNLFILIFSGLEFSIGLLIYYFL